MLYFKRMKTNIVFFMVWLVLLTLWGFYDHFIQDQRVIDDLEERVQLLEAKMGVTEEATRELCEIHDVAWPICGTETADEFTEYIESISE